MMICKPSIFLLFLFTLQNGVNSNTIYDARLTNGYYGTVELLTYRGWRPLCRYYNYWSSSQPRVLCRQYGLEYSSFSTTSAQSSSLNSLAFSISCSGIESELSQCLYSFSGEFSSCSYGLVTVSCAACSNGNVRLKESIVPEAGTVEYCVGGVWKAICDRNWDYKDAYVVCRQLGLPATDAVRYQSSYFGNHKYQSGMYFNCFGNESSLANCRLSTSSSCDEDNAAGVHCRGERVAGQCNMNGQVRLAGGKSEYEGRVEICSNGVWGTVYDRYWNVQEAIVVCRQLGFPVSQSRAEPLYLYQDLYGMGTGPILYGYLNCVGTESTLAQCSTYGSYSGASHSRDAGVKCQRVSIVRSNCANGDVRLENGTTPYEGRVEICYDGVWGSVCDSSWNDQDAAIVCLQLGFQGANASAIQSSFFGDGAGPYHLSSLSCSGEERTLLDCSYSNQSIISSSRCGSGRDAGVRCDASVCIHGEVRLFGGSVSYGNIGVAEVCINGKWADICDDVNNKATISTTFCRQLIGEPLSFGTSCCTGVSRRNTGNTTLYDITCNAHSRRLTDDCSFSIVSGYSTAGCSLQEELVVGCYELSSCTVGDLRLIGGNSSLEGRVEVCSQGMWGAIYANYIYQWSMNNAKVVCRQLGYPWNWVLAERSGLFGRGNDRITARDFRCTGTEERLLDCPHYTVTLSDYASYQSGATAGVICQGNTSMPIECEQGDVRLVDGPKEMEGRVEICASGYWSIACDSSSYWNGINQAKLICRQLKLPTTWIDYISGSPFGSNYQLPIVGLSCGSGATNVSGCQIYTQISGNCNHKRTMGVICRDLEHHKVIVSVSPVQKSYELGSQVTLRCIAPQSYGNFVIPRFYYRWFSTRSGNLHNSYSSVGSATYSFTIPTSHPKSAEYYCDIYRNGQFLGSGKITITVKDILRSSNSSKLKFHPQETLTLQDEMLSINVIRLLVELTWYHNGSIIVPSHDQRVTISNSNKTLTVTNFTFGDTGVYTVQFNQLLIYPHNQECTDDFISFVRKDPLLRPVVFCVNLDKSDCNSMEMQSRLSREISVKATEISIHGTINSVTLEAKSVTNSIEEARYASFYWYRRGRRITSGLTTLQKRYQSLSQNMQLSNITYEMTGRYDVVLVLNLYTYFIDMGCPQYYNHFVLNYGAVPQYLPLAKGYVDVDYYKDLVFNLDSNKKVVARNDHEGATLTCRASIEFPPFSILSLIKNGQTLSSSTNGSLQIGTRNVDINQFGLYTCQLNATGVTFQRSYVLKEKAALRMTLDTRGFSICNNSEMAIKTLDKTLIQKIIRECRCSFSQDGLKYSTINCENRQLTYTTTLEYSDEEGSETASIIAGRIIGQVPFSMAIGGTQLTVRSACTDCEMPSTKAAAISLSPAVGGALFISGFLAALLITITVVIIVILAVKRCAKSKDKDGRRVEVNTDPLRYASTGAVHQNVSLKETAAEYMAPQPKKQSEYQAIGRRDQPSQYDTMQVDDQPIYEDTF